jgi:putative transposase
MFWSSLGQNGLQTGLSQRGNVWDNAAILKTEQAARKVYRKRNDARADVFDYIECFYNPRRGHPTLGYMSSVEFEEKATKNRQQAIYSNLEKIQGPGSADTRSYEWGWLGSRLSHRSFLCIIQLTNPSKPTPAAASAMTPTNASL